MKKFWLCMSVLLLFSSATLAAEEQSVAENAVALRRYEELRNLLHEGYDVNTRNDKGESLLYYALVSHAPIKIMRIILDNGADINAPSAESGMTPLIYAISATDRIQQDAEEVLAQESSIKTDKQIFESNLRDEIAKEMVYAVKVVHFLVDQGADLNQETPHGTPLIKAVKNEWNKDIVEYLINSGANVNQQDRYGRTALFYAEASGNSDIVMILLSANADTEIKDSNGKTYLEVDEKILEP